MLPMSTGGLYYRSPRSPPELALHLRFEVFDLGFDLVQLCLELPVQDYITLEEGERGCKETIKITITCFGGVEIFVVQVHSFKILDSLVREL